MNDYFLIIFIILRIPTKLNEFMAKIDEKEKKIRKVFGMSYSQYVNVNRQIHQKSREDMKSRKTVSQEIALNENQNNLQPTKSVESALNT